MSGSLPGLHVALILLKLGLRICDPLGPRILDEDPLLNQV